MQPWTTPPAPAGPPHGAAPRRAGATVAVAVLAVVVLGGLVAALVAWGGAGSGHLLDRAANSSAAPPSSAAPTTTANGSAPPSTSTPAANPPGTTGGGGPGASSPALTKAIDDAIAFIEKTRGVRFVSRPTVVAQPDAEFTKRFLEVTERDIAKNKDSYDEGTAVLQAVGILPAGISLPDATRAFGASGVLGFYDPESKELRVRGGSVTPLVRTIIVHELTHALDDQLYDLDRPELDDRKDEVPWTFSALAEGSARWVESAYRAQLSVAERAQATQEELSLARDIPVAKVGMPFIELQGLPYDDGEQFVASLRSQGGEAALAAAFGDPPKSSEQVLDPAAYRAHDDPVAVPAPPADGQRIDDGAVGEVIWRLLFEATGSAQKVAQGTDGWRGDNSVAWRDGSRTCLRADVVFDTAKDADEFGTLAKSWARSRPSGAVDKPAATTVRVTSCSA